MLNVLNTNSSRISKIHPGGRSLQMEWKNCETIMKPSVTLCLNPFKHSCEKNGLQSLSWHYLRNKLQRKTCRVAPFPLDDIIGRVCFDFRLAFPPGDIALDKLVCFDLRLAFPHGDIGQTCVFWFKTSESWPGSGTTSLGNKEAKGRTAGQPTSTLTATIISGKLSKRKLQFLDKL